MDLTNVGFVNWIDPQGYEVAKDADFLRETNGELVLWTKSSIKNLQREATHIQPLGKNPFLMEELSRLSKEAESISDWVSSYGFLFTPEHRETKSRPDRYVNKLEDCVAAIRLARAYIQYYEVWKTNRDDKNLFTDDSLSVGFGDLANETGVIYRDLFWSDPSLWTPVPRLKAEPGSRYDLSDYSLLAERVLWRHLEAKLNGKSENEALFTYGPPGRVRIGTHLDDGRRFQKMVLIPQDLYSAIWIQAAMILHEEKYSRTCPVCLATWLSNRLETEPIYSNSQVCCGRRSCNVTATNRRKTAAYTQARAGKSIDQIFEHVNSLGLGRSRKVTIVKWREQALNP